MAPFGLIPACPYPTCPYHIYTWCPYLQHTSLGSMVLGHLLELITLCPPLCCSPLWLHAPLVRGNPTHGDPLCHSMLSTGVGCSWGLGLNRRFSGFIRVWTVASS